MIGKLIPAGTGMKRYGEVEVDYGEYTDFVNGKAVMEETEEEVLHIAGLETETISTEGDEVIEVYGEKAIVE